MEENSEEGVHTCRSTIESTQSSEKQLSDAESIDRCVLEQCVEEHKKWTNEAKKELIILKQMKR